MTIEKKMVPAILVALLAVSVAGAETEQGLTPMRLEELIRSAGRIPVERDTFYQPIHSLGTVA